MRALNTIENEPLTQAIIAMQNARGKELRDFPEGPYNLFRHAQICKLLQAGKCPTIRGSHIPHCNFCPAVAEDMSTLESILSDNQLPITLDRSTTVAGYGVRISYGHPEGVVKDALTTFQVNWNGSKNGVAAVDNGTIDIWVSAIEPFELAE